VVTSPRGLIVIAKTAMTRETDAKSARLFDRRTVERNIKKGLITRKDYEKHLKTLADVGEKGTHGAEDPSEAAEDRAPETSAGEPSGTNSHN
jgi:hypothetical protein